MPPLKALAPSSAGGRRAFFGRQPTSLAAKVAAIPNGFVTVSQNSWLGPKKPLALRRDSNK